MSQIFILPPSFSVARRAAVVLAQPIELSRVPDPYRLTGDGVSDEIEARVDVVPGTWDTLGERTALRTVMVTIIHSGPYLKYVTGRTSLVVKRHHTAFATPAIAGRARAGP